MTTFGLVAGGGHNAWCWARLAPELERRGHSVVAVTLPSDQLEAGLAEYAATVGAALSGSTGEVVLVGHSAAGRYLPLAAGLVPRSRIVFLCSFIPEVGVPVATGPGGGASRFFEKGRVEIPREQARDLFYNDCDDETANWALDRVHDQGTLIMSQTFPEDGWPDGLRCAVVCCTDDRIARPARSREQALARLGVEPIEIPGGHSPFLSRPDTLADTLVGLLDDTGHWGVRQT